jgi:hypothetical protein
MGHMAQFDSSTTEEPGQYPAPNFTTMHLPSQDFGSGAPGSGQPSKLRDQGSTNEPGQYPARETFTGVPLGGSGAPGSAGIPYDGAGGSDSITYSAPTFYKGMREDGDMFSESDGTGYQEFKVSGQVSGKGDWTQANPQGYQASAQYQMPGVAGNTPAPGDAGRFQTDGSPDSSGHVMYGGWLKGQRPATDQHPSFSGPGS